MPTVKFVIETPKGYLESVAPVSFTLNLEEAYITPTLTLESYTSEDLKEILINPIAAVSSTLGSLNIKILIYDESETISSSYSSYMEIRGTALELHSHPGIDMDTLKLLKSLSTELIDYLYDIYMSVKTKGMSISGVIDDIKETLGIGKGTIPTSDSGIEDILEFIAEKTKAEVVKPSDTLDDYVCEKSLKAELLEIKDFFENEKLYKDTGIELPKGILFKGPPGTGKTYAARCIAGSVDCYFMTCTASALQGMYIGSGAENIRALFKGAKLLREKSGKGVIIFIDELDSFGSRENKSGNGASGEEDRTLNQLLAELSGFEDAQGIMVLAATNYAERLDDALMRSGRFSRQITIDYPREHERRVMVEYYFKKIKLPLDDTNYDEITILTEGLTPADIKEIVNEASILTIRHKLSKITLANINEAINKVITKNIKREDGELDIPLISAHEAGHVLAEVLLEKSVPIKVTSYSYGDAGGFTQSTFRLSGILPKDKYINYVKILLAGRAAEEVLCKSITNGASNDLSRAKKILKHYYETYMFESYKEADLNQIVLDDIHKLYKETVELFSTEENYKMLDTLTKCLCKDRVLYNKDIKSIAYTKFLETESIL